MTTYRILCVFVPTRFMAEFCLSLVNTEASTGTNLVDTWKKVLVTSGYTYDAEHSGTCDPKPILNNTYNVSADTLRAPRVH